MWRCNHKYDNNEKCKSSHIYEEKLKELFIKAFNELIKNKDEILKDYKKIINTLGDTSKLEREKFQLENEAEILVELIKKYMEKNSKAVINQDEYESKYNELAKKYEELKIKIEDKEKKIFNQKIKNKNIIVFIGILEQCKELITEFDEELFINLVDRIKIKSKEKLKVYFKDGVIVEVNI